MKGLSGTEKKEKIMEKEIIGQCPKCGGEKVYERNMAYVVYEVVNWKVYVEKPGLMIDIEARTYGQRIVKPMDNNELLDPPYECGECGFEFDDPVIVIRGVL